MGGSRRLRQLRVWAGDRLKQVAEPRTERAVVDRTANLEQKIGASSRPSHLLRFVHSSIDKEVRSPFGHRSSDTQAGAISLGVIDEPVALAAEVAVDFVQRRPQLARRHAFRAMAVLALEDMHDLADPVDAAPGILGLAVPDAPAQPLDLRDDHGLRRPPTRLAGRQSDCRLLRVLESHGDMKPVGDWWIRDPGLGQNRSQSGAAVGERGQLRLVGADPPQSLPAYRFVASLNEMNHIHERRLTLLRNHVPAEVMLILIGVSMVAMGFTGYHAGVVGAQRRIINLIMSIMVAVLIMLVVDLDRPSRGLIFVPVQPLIDVAHAIPNSNVAPGMSETLGRSRRVRPWV